MKREIDELFERARAGVVRVGDGRFRSGEGEPVFAPWHTRRLIVTAAHCLPSMPPAITGMDLNEKTWLDLVGPLGEKPSVAVACLFADPLSDGRAWN